jgi:uncharacterized protein YndB with AHSA1/START domain
MAKISHKITVQAAPDRVFKILSTAEGLKGWYTPQLDGSVREGKEVVLKFMGEKPFRWRVAESTPDSRVRWECVEGPGAAVGTTVTFRLSNKGDGQTSVECDHDGWGESDPSFTACNTKWGILMAHLKGYAETAKAAPAFH